MLNFKTVNSVSILLLLGIFIGSFFYSISYYYFGFILLTWLTTTTIGSFNILWNYFVKGYHSNPSIKTNSVAITFDDGPHPEFTPKALDLLKQHNVKATFFCIGKHVEEYPEIVKRIHDEGHTIGNHTYNHATNFGFMNTQQVVDEIQQTDSSIFKIINKKPLLFRPPFGVTNPSVAKAIKTTQHYLIGWNNRSLDTVIKSEEKILKRITKKIKPGDIILLHDTSDKTINVLERFLINLQDKNYSSTTIDVLLNTKPYE